MSWEIAFSGKSHERTSRETTSRGRDNLPRLFFLFSFFTRQLFECFRFVLLPVPFFSFSLGIPRAFLSQLQSPSPLFNLASVDFLDKPFGYKYQNTSQGSKRGGKIVLKSFIQLSSSEEFVHVGGGGL